MRGPRGCAPKPQCDHPGGRPQDEAPRLETPSRGAVDQALIDIEQLVSRQHEAGKFPVIIGGEHTLTVGCIRGLKKHISDLSVLQLDAHADLRDKWEGTPFSQMVTVGRAQNNDLIIVDTNVSKFHAYFSEGSDGTHSLADGGSTTGTFVEYLPLEKNGERKDLDNGNAITFGGNLHFIFYTPEGFYQFLKEE